MRQTWLLLSPLAICLLGAGTSTSDGQKPKAAPPERCQMGLDSDPDKRASTLRQRADLYRDCVRKHPGTEDPAEAEKKISERTATEAATQKARKDNLHRFDPKPPTQPKTGSTSSQGMGASSNEVTQPTASRRSRRRKRGLLTTPMAWLSDPAVKGHHVWA